MRTARQDPLFPLMDSSSAVFPTIRTNGDVLYLAYYLPGCCDSAVVAFHGVSSWSYGGPNDEGLHTHPQWGHGLEFYAFHEVTPVPQHGERHWIATFHDGTFDVVATGAPEVCGSRVEGCSPSEALNKLLGVGQTKVLDEVA